MIVVLIQAYLPMFFKEVLFLGMMSVSRIYSTVISLSEWYLQRPPQCLPTHCEVHLVSLDGQPQEEQVIFNSGMQDFTSIL